MDLKLDSSFDSIENLFQETRKKEAERSAIKPPPIRPSALRKNSPKIIVPKKPHSVLTPKKKSTSHTNLAIIGQKVVSESVSMMPHRPYPVECSNSPKLGSVPVDFPYYRPQQTPFFVQRKTIFENSEHDNYHRRKRRSNSAAVHHKLRIITP